MDQLVAAGAPVPEDTSEVGLQRWLTVQLSRVTRPLKHPGNHRYLFGLTSAVKRRLPASLPYPKMNMGQLAFVPAA